MRIFGRRAVRAILSSSICLLCQTAFAQTPPDDLAKAAHAPDPDNGVGNYAEGLFIPMVAGQPFRARIEAQVTRQLPDGTATALKYYALEARDADGRAYREVRDMIAAGSAMEPALIRTYIYDSKASLVSICVPSRQSCEQMPLQPPPEEEELGPSKDGKSELTRESLGAKTMDGIEVIGTRETRTFIAGAFGNDKPVVVTKEFWYSPRLQFNLSVTRSDPRSGVQKLEVTDLKLGDPGSEWFAIPAGYRIVSQRAIPRPQNASELEPLIEKDVPGISPDTLRTDLGPLEAAIGAFAKAHAEAAPNDSNDAVASQLRLRLSTDFYVLQQNPLSPRPQAEQADRRLNETYLEVLSSPCLNKPAPGDPPSMPKDEASLREEERAWLGVRDAWIVFLKKMYPHGDPDSWSWMITNERDSDLRKMQTVERNRGCAPEESIAPQLENLVTGMTVAQLAEAVKPVDAAIAAYAKAHAESSPNDRNDFFLRMTQQNLLTDLRMEQQGHLPTRDQFEDADLHLNQAYRAVIGSPCLSKPIPADPPNAPVSEENLRAEERAWVGVRDAWTVLMTRLFPDAGNSAGFGATLTEMRANELRQIQVIERNRGCRSDEQ